MRALLLASLVGLGAPAWAAPAPAPESDSRVPIEAAPVLGDDYDADLTEGAVSKKQQALAEKSKRKRVHLAHVTDRLAHPALTLHNIWTREIIAVDPARPPAPETLNPFLRDHFTNQATQMDPRLGEILLRAATQFQSSLIEIVSGYRSEKYNLMLRKKGHAVARDSQHPRGDAVDFRVAGVPTRKLFKFVRSLRLGGAGYYPHTGFVHADFGRIRTWVGN